MSSKNLYGDPLEQCAASTGFLRDGKCKFSPRDVGQHLICAKMSSDFLTYTRSKGNSLPGLNEGDNWCICVGRYNQALMDNHAPEIVRESTNEVAKAHIIQH